MNGVPVVIALVEFGIIVFLYLSRRNAKRAYKQEFLDKRKAELRMAAPLDKPIVPR